MMATWGAAAKMTEGVEMEDKAMQDGVIRFAHAYAKSVERALEAGKSLPQAANVLLSEDLWKGFGVEPPCVDRLQFLLFTLPPVIARNQVEHYFGGLYKRQTLANRDAQRRGPRLRFEFGTAGTMYPTPFLLEWIEQQNMNVVTIHVA